MEYLVAGLIAFFVMLVASYLFDAGVRHMYGPQDDIIDFGED